MSKLVAASFGSPLKIEEGTAKNKAINVTVTPEMKAETYTLNVTSK